MKDAEIKKAVREGYAEIARQKGSCCGQSASSCCGGANRAQDISQKIGYSSEDMASVPEDANLGLGCGNPVAVASLVEGETVLDLGSAAGFDCFLAANRVGKMGKVVGVDMTPEMIEKARQNAREGGYDNVEFRLGEIENIPAADSSFDVAISNCVINLSPDKQRVFNELFRVLKPGGRLMISDIVLVKELPDLIKDSIPAYIGCISGAIMKGDYIRVVAEAGFDDVKIVDEASFPIDCMFNDPTARLVIDGLNLPESQVQDVADSVISIKIQGVKPKAR